MTKARILGRNILHFTYITQHVNPYEFYEVFLNGQKMTKNSFTSAQNTGGFQTF